jgi:hypothetical protein
MNIFRLFRKAMSEVPSADRNKASSALSNAMSRPDMICACRGMEAKELALAESAQTTGLRVDHVYNAASWAERAELLQRLENSVNKRNALDAAERDRAGADRLIAREQGVSNGGTRTWRSPLCWAGARRISQSPKA